MVVIATLEDIYTPGRVSIIPRVPPESKTLSGSFLDLRGSKEQCRRYSCQESQLFNQPITSDTAPMMATVQVSMTVTLHRDGTARVVENNTRVTQAAARKVSPKLIQNNDGSKLPPRKQSMAKEIAKHGVSTVGKRNVEPRNAQTMKPKVPNKALFDVKLSPIRAHAKRTCHQSSKRGSRLAFNPTGKDLPSVPLDLIGDIDAQDGIFVEI